MLRLAAVFGEHMVLQAGKPIAVFGEADGPVEITIAQHSVTAACEDGWFLARLPALPASGPHTLTARCGQECVVLGDVMIGEVWLCGGQSNMEFRLRDERHFSEANAMQDSRVRFYEVPQAATDSEAEALERGRAWTPLLPGACADVSAVSFYAAREMAQRLNVAVGMIICCIGGTSASCWMSREALAAFPEGQAYLTEFDQHVAGKTDGQFEQESAAYQKEVDAWNAAVAAMKVENPDIPFADITARAGAFPWPPPWGRTMLRWPAGPFETMLKRVAPVALRGFLFYQGEQDSTPARAPGYAALLTAMIAQWRALFEDETLFFAAAQLPRFGAEPDDEDWPAIRAAQQAVALAHVYDEPVQADAPRLARAGLAGEKLTLRFVCTGGGLDVPEGGLPSLRVEGAALKRLCGCDDALVLTLEDAGPTVRVRYAQENWPEAVLMGENGLPVFPFDVTVARS